MVEGGRRPTVGGADGKGDVLGALIAASAEPCGEFGGGKGASTAVEEHGEDGGSGEMGGTSQPGKKRGFRLKSFRLQRVPGSDAVKVQSRKSIETGLLSCPGSFGTDVRHGEKHEGSVYGLAEVGGHLRDEIGYEPAVHESMENYIPVKSMA